MVRPGLHCFEVHWRWVVFSMLASRSGPRLDAEDWPSWKAVETRIHGATKESVRVDNRIRVAPGNRQAAIGIRHHTGRRGEKPARSPEVDDGAGYLDAALPILNLESLRDNLIVTLASDVRRVVPERVLVRRHGNAGARRCRDWSSTGEQADST